MVALLSQTTLHIILITFGQHLILSFDMVIGIVDLDDFVDLIDVRQTLRILWFGEQIAS